MNLGMSEVVKKQFIHFLRENGANIPDMAEISVPVMPLDFSKYFLHAYLRPDESQMEYALDNGGFKIYNNYNEDYLNAVLEFLEIEDINRDCVSTFSAEYISYDGESVITLTFSLQELKKANQLDRFLTFYNQVILDTLGTSTYFLRVERNTVKIIINLVEKSVDK